MVKRRQRRVLDQRPAADHHRNARSLEQLEVTGGVPGTTVRNVILFLTSKSAGAAHLALDEECAAIERELHMTSGRHDLEFCSRWAATIDDMMHHLNELKPTVVHFSGHCNAAGIDVPDVQGRRRGVRRDVVLQASTNIQLKDHRRRQVSASALTRMISSAAPSTRLVVLNACFSDRIAESLCDVVDCVVGMRGAIDDNAAISFAMSFYRALGYRRSVGNALAQAVATLAAKEFPNEHFPVCITRDGLCADEIVLSL